MSPHDVLPHISRRIASAGLTVPAEVQTALAAYLELLARWNQRINLTAFTLAPASDEAIDRLIIEPLAAASRVRPGDRVLIDIGSGGGSPAIPLRIACPQLRLVLVESKVRKCAFLREAVRQLGLGGVEVENRRVEELMRRPDLREAADVVSLRAVRADAVLWAGVQMLARPGGRVFWFTSSAGPAAPGVGFPLLIERAETLLAATGSQLVVLLKPE